jgi:flagellar biosynthesis protein FlhA
VGDGLVSQIPALIIATAAGILVTKATSQTSVGQEISSQVAANPKVLMTAAGLLGALALTPGLPKIPFVLLAVGLWIGARRVAQASKAKQMQPASDQAAPAKVAVESPLDEFLQVDRACLEIGAKLIPMVDPKRGTGLLDRISGLRRDMGKQNGLWVPPIRVRDNLQLEPEAYRILIGGREVTRGSIRPGSWLAIDPGGTRLKLTGEAVRDPAFGLAATWIAEPERQRAEMAGYTVVDASGVVITHLGESLRRHAPELLGREDLKQLVDKVRETSPSLVDDLIPAAVTMGMLHRVLSLLLEERAPISNLTRILESLSHHVPFIKEPAELTERVRMDLGRAICDRFRDSEGRLHAIVLDPRLELECRRNLHDKQLTLDPGRLEKFLTKLANEWRKAAGKSMEVALLCDTMLRRPLRQMLSRSLADLAVIAYQEVPADMLLEPAALVKLEDLA